jgi:hypothetical protein
MDLTTNGVVITDAIKFVQINKEKLTLFSKEDNGSKESEEPDYDPIGSVIMKGPQSSEFPLEIEVQAETYSISIGFSTGITTALFL